jgi:hypothetical protein
VLLFEKSDAIDHLLRSGACRLESASQSGVLSFQKLNALGRNDTLHSCRLEALEPRLGLKRTSTKGSQLVTEMLHQLLELRKSGFLR